ncbi:MAG: ABC transporter substrate-binding protein [Actinomycetota bacterium]|nr:ABC transporter substrate-binding protein [Actinomycetota bacterium]
MRRKLKLIAIIAVLGMVTAACAAADDDGGGGGSGDSTQEEVQPGGIFKGALLSDVSDAWDPHKAYYTVNWGFYRCCLLRTLLNYNGLPAEDGGNDPLPDLAEDQPEVSEDGTEWTFTLKEGIKYQPPMDDVTVTAEDFVRSFERLADPKASEGGYAFYYSIIEGFDDFSAGKADTISGIEAVDDTTLKFTLTGNYGDFGQRVAMPATAPLPEGVADGHVRDYGRFLIGTGPYMFEGAEDLDFEAAPEDQKPVSGYQPNRSFTLVRNPSYDPETDDLRDAYIDGIEVEIGGTEEDIANKIDAGELDLSIDGIPPAQQIREYLSDPELEDQVFSNPSDAVRYLSFNIAEPPFDDVNMRKAVNAIVDKDGMRRLRGGPQFGEIAGHIIVDNLLDDELADYFPYGNEDGTPDLEGAKEFMKESKYDSDGDGVCDAPECKDVFAVTDQADPYADQAALIEDSLKEIGIELQVQSLERDPMYEKCNDAGAHVAICLGPAWGKDYADATTFAAPLFGSVSIGPDSCCNYSLVGADSKTLGDLDYAVTDVPSVDDKIDECDKSAESERVGCWAELDQMLMEEVVPWVPYLFDNDVDVVSERIVNYTFDQFHGGMALDHIGIQE